MKLEKEEVKRLAELARFELSEEEAAEFSHQLSEETGDSSPFLNQCFTG
jgi:Asp-tRNA(Asn)/Glu-tRNA(Gln) amidotransferase C subunit